MSDETALDWLERYVRAPGAERLELDDWQRAVLQTYLDDGDRLATPGPLVVAIRARRSHRLAPLDVG